MRARDRLRAGAARHEGLQGDVNGNPLKLTSHEYRLLEPTSCIIWARWCRAPNWSSTVRSGFRPRLQYDRGVRRAPAQEDRRRPDRDRARPRLSDAIWLIFGAGHDGDQRACDPCWASRPLNGACAGHFRMVREGASATAGRHGFPPKSSHWPNETNELIEKQPAHRGTFAHSGRQSGAFAEDAAGGTDQRGQGSIGGAKGRLIAGTGHSSMREQVEHYLQRARMAAQRDSIVFPHAGESDDGAHGARGCEAETRI
jgi:hypothetical protein